MRFLFAWQHVDAEHRLSGIDGLRAVLEQLDGFELAADGWERAVLPARVDGYEPSMLDTLCLTGEVGWARLSSAGGEPTQVVSATPVALFLRAARRGLGSPEGLRRARCVERTATVAQRRLGLRRGWRTTRVRRSARRRRACPRPLARAEARRSSTSSPAPAGIDEKAVRAALRDLGGRRPRRVGWIRRPAIDHPRSTGRPGAAGHRSSIAGTLVAAARRAGRRPTRRRRRRAAGADAAEAVRRRLPAAADARSERRAVARAGARLSAARSARRDPRRPLRRGHVRRAVRACRRGRAAARGPPHAAARPLHRGQRRRPAQSRRHRHRRRARPGGGGEPARLSRRRPACSARRRVHAIIDRGRPDRRLGRGQHPHRASGASRWSAVLSGGRNANRPS